MNIEITGGLTVKDYFLFWFHQARYLLLIELFLIVYFIFLVISEDVSQTVRILLYVFTPIAGGLFLSGISFLKIKKEYTIAEKKSHEKIVKINEKGIEYGTRQSQIFYRWEDIRRGFFLKKEILLYISRKQALIIPRRFFNSIEEEEKWIDVLKHYLSK